MRQTHFEGCPRPLPPPLAAEGRVGAKKESPFPGSLNSNRYLELVLLVPADDIDDDLRGASCVIDVDLATGADLDDR